MAGRQLVCLAVVLALGAELAGAYYLPGTYPQEFAKGSSIEGECQGAVGGSLEGPLH